jgi:hypothetical protein
MRQRRGAIIGMLFTLVFTVAGIGLAHDQRDQDASYTRSSQSSRQEGYENGYGDGARHAREDRQRGLGYSVRSDDFKKADRGYQKYMGDKGDYKAGYREGYQAGYDTAYNRNDRGGFGGRYGRGDDRYGWGNTNGRDPYYSGKRDPYYSGGGYNGIAFQNGYRDGLDDGQKDLRKNDRFDPNDHGDYRDADNGYKGSYGNKDAYRQQYRQGYLRGYEEGYGRRQYGRW